MTDPKQSLPQSVIDEAWSEYLYPRAAVEGLSHPQPTSGFVRAMRVIQQWATEHDAYWSQVYDHGITSALEHAQQRVDQEAKEIRHRSDVDRYGEGKADGLERAGTVLSRCAAAVRDHPVKFSQGGVSDV